MSDDVAADALARLAPVRFGRRLTPMRWRRSPVLLFAVATVALAAMLYELALARVLAVAVGSPWTWPTLGAAALGVGLGALLPVLAPRLGALPPERLWLRAALAMAAALVVAYPLGNALPLYLSAEAKAIEIVSCGLAWALVASPFAAAGLFLASAHDAHSDAAPWLCACEIGGAALGVVVYAAALPHLGAPGLWPLAAACALAAAFALCERTLSQRALFGLGLTIVLALAPMLETVLPLARPVGKRERVPEGHSPPVRLHWTPRAALETVMVKDGVWLVQDGGDTLTRAPLLPRHRPPPPPSGEWALPFALGPNQRVLVQDAGGGEVVALALGAGARQVTALESDPGIRAEVEGRLNAALGGLFHLAKVELRSDDGLTFLARSGNHAPFDLITSLTRPPQTVTGVLAFPAADALTTATGLRHALGALSANGLLLLAGPDTEALAIALALRRAWTDRGASDAEADAPAPPLGGHVVVLAPSSPAHTVWFLVRARPFDAALLATLRSHAAGRVLYAPDQNDTDPDLAAALTGVPVAVPPSALAAAARVALLGFAAVWLGLFGLCLARLGHAGALAAGLTALGLGQSGLAALLLAAVVPLLNCPVWGVLVALALLLAAAACGAMWWTRPGQASAPRLALALGATAALGIVPLHYNVDVAVAWPAWLCWGLAVLLCLGVGAFWAAPWAALLCLRTPTSVPAARYGLHRLGMVGGAPLAFALGAACGTGAALAVAVACVVAGACWSWRLRST